MKGLDKMGWYGRAEWRGYGRNERLDKFFTKLLGRSRAYEIAWVVKAYLARWFPTFEKWTRGRCLWIETAPNGITNAGHAEVVGLIGDTGSCTAFTYLAYGTGSTAFAATQTALVTQSQRAAATVSRITTTVTNDTLQLVKTFSVVATEVAAEGGGFNASSSGDMLCRVVYSTPRSMVSGNTLAYTHTVQST